MRLKNTWFLCSKQMKIPFWIWPFSWGLRGKAREIARAEYELTGAERELRVHELRCDEFKSRDYAERALQIKRRHGLITEEEFQRGFADLIDDMTTKKLAHLAIDRDFGKITEKAYEKTVATVKGEPWVSVVHMDFDTKNSLEGSFELDWNDIFVDKLQEEGYTGPSPDHIVNTWFMEVCKNIAMEEYDGTGNFHADAEHNIETMKRWHQAPVDKDRSSYK